MQVRVLLVDDEEEFIKYLSQRLEARNFAVDTAYSGDQAITCIKEKDIDVMVLDVLMPGRDGVDTLREIKRIKPLIEVIMLTGHATVETAIEGMRLGAFDYLIKPTETNDLVEKISKAFKRKEEQEERIRQAEINKIVKSRGW